MKAALIGTGYWGSKLRKYISEFFDLSYCANTRTDLRQIWKDKSTRAVIIATPINTHFAIARDAIEAGKHVFVEKPIAMKVSEARKLKESAVLAGVKIGVEYTQTFSPGINWLKSNIKKIGHLKHIEMETKHLGRFNDYNVYWLLASHWLSVVDMFWTLDSFNVGKFGRPDIQTGSILMSWMGCSVKIDVSINFPGKTMSAVFYGADGTAIYDPVNNLSQIIKYERPYNTTKINCNIERFDSDEKNNLRESMRYFKNITEGNAESNVDRAIRVTRVLESLEDK